MKKASLLLLSLFLLWGGPASAIKNKPFRRALVLTGGGISPGLALGMIHGMRAAGKNPDVIIATCGSTLGVAIAAAIPDPLEAKQFLRSEKFYRALKNAVRLRKHTAHFLLERFDGIRNNPELIPDVFTGILDIPTDPRGIIPGDRFPTGTTRVIFIGARALFGPEDVGFPKGELPLFTETFFTDRQTARWLKGRASTVHKIFSSSRVSARTEVRSDVTLTQASRASISDPFYMNPAVIGNTFYFGGAVDLFPVETAKALAAEVYMTPPSGHYTSSEDLAIGSTFGFSQSDRAWIVPRTTGVHWINSKGFGSVGMDPTLTWIFFSNMMPKTHDEFWVKVNAQYRLGYARAVEAVQKKK